MKKKVSLIFYYTLVDKMLYKKGNTGNTIWAIWKVEECYDELLSMLVNKEWLEDVLAAKSQSRQCEMLATRVLLKGMLGEEKQICYHKSGAPFLKGDSYQLSISHTKGYVAVILDEQKTMGLDIEYRSDKILRVKDRVITKYDFIDPDNQQVHLLLHWCAKEAMFKYLDAEGVDFRQNLHIEQFTPTGEGVFQVSESKTNEHQKFDAHYIVDDDFVFVYLVESSIFNHV